MFGSRCLKTYSSTEDIITISSREPEFNGNLRAGSHGLGMVGLWRDLGLKVSLRINTGSSAAKSIGSRRGAGKARHVDVKELWLQERLNRGDMVLRKVPGAENLADILTKHVPRSCLDKRLIGVGVVRASGRHPLNLSL